MIVFDRIAFDTIVLDDRTGLADERTGLAADRTGLAFDSTGVFEMVTLLLVLLAEGADFLVELPIRDFF